MQDLFNNFYINLPLLSYREPIAIPNNINNVLSNKSAAKKPKATPASVPLHLYLFMTASFIICAVPAMLILAFSLSEYNCYSYAALKTYSIYVISSPSGFDTAGTHIAVANLPQYTA